LSIYYWQSFGIAMLYIYNVCVVYFSLSTCTVNKVDQYSLVMTFDYMSIQNNPGLYRLCCAKRLYKAPFLLFYRRDKKLIITSCW